MAKERARSAERETRNRGLREEDSKLRDPEKRTPHRAADQASPQPERPKPPRQDAEQDVAQLENPPQVEGPRERSNQGV